MISLRAREWSLAEWMSNEGAWSELLARSGADRLFLSWQWLTDWWRLFGQSPGSAPCVFGIYCGETLVGLAPFYRRWVVRGRLLPVRSVQLIGLSWRDSGAMISEYLDVIARPGLEAAVRLASLQALRDRAFGELVIASTAAGSQWREAFTGLGILPGSYTREVDRSIAYQADLAQGFPAYLRQLGQSSRRSVWHLRRRLALFGEARLERIAPSDIASGFADLNRLHQLRWQIPAFTGRRLEFHSVLAQRLALQSELVFSRLRVGGKVVSVLYDIRKGARQYNVKMAFDPFFSNRLSVGLIHLGYAMEEAASQGVEVYDFLAGPGRTTDYKRHLGQTQCALSSLQILTAPLLSWLYKRHDRTR